MGLDPCRSRQGDMGAAAEGNENRSIRLVRDALGHSHCPTAMDRAAAAWTLKP